MLLMLLSLVTWSGACLGWGLGAMRLLRADGGMRTGITIHVWIGWCVVLFLLQAGHLLHPIDRTFTWFLLAAGWMLVVIFRGDLRSFGLVHRRGFGAAFCGYAVFTLLVLSKGMDVPQDVDSGLYHFQQIRWALQYPVVPGMGLLGVTMAYNQSFFLHAASMNHLFVPGYGHCLANSALVLLAMATMCEHLLMHASEAGTLHRPVSFTFWSLVVLAGHFVVTILLSTRVSSPTPDLASYTVQMALFVLILQGWFAHDGAWTQVHDVVVVMMAAALATMKPSNFAFAGMLVLVWGLLRLRALPRRLLIMLFACLVVSISTWLARGYIVSGAPLYPSSLGHVSFEWSVSVESIDHAREVIFDLARGWSGPHGSGSGLQWVGGWVGQIPRMFVLHVLPVVVAFVLFLIAVPVHARHRSRIRTPHLLSGWLWALPPLAGLVAWFFTAPNPRFINAQAQMLLVLSIAMFSGIIASAFGPRIMMRVAVTLVVFHAAVLLQHAYEWKYKAAMMSLAGVQPIPKLETGLVRNRHGVVLHVARQGLLWDAPLPASYDACEDVTYRVPGDVSKGFRGWAR